MIPFGPGPQIAVTMCRADKEELGTGPPGDHLFSRSRGDRRHPNQHHDEPLQKNAHPQRTHPRMA